MGFDRERLARQVALLDGLGIGKKGRNAEGVGPDLIVGVAKLAFEEHPAGDAGVGADHDRLALECGEAVVPLPGMGDQHRRVLLENRRNGDHRNVFLHEIQRNEGVWRKVEVEPAGGEQLRVIDLRPALPQRDFEAVLTVNPRGDRLVVAAVLGLRFPIRAKGDCFRACRAARQGQTGRHPHKNSDRNPHSRQLRLPRPQI